MPTRRPNAIRNALIFIVLFFLFALFWAHGLLMDGAYMLRDYIEQARAWLGSLG